MSLNFFKQFKSVVLKSILPLYVLTLTLPAESNDQVKFFFQSAYDRNKFELAALNDLNILYINAKCEYCFTRIQEILNYNPRSRFIVVTTTTTWQNLKTLVDKNCQSEQIKKLVYYDPGRRLEKALKLGDNEASYVYYTKGFIQSNYSFTLSQSIKNPYLLKVWKN